METQTRRVTIDDIAGLAGLHRVTVARILQGSYPGRQETCDRVLRIAREMKYSPDLIARAMRFHCLPIVLASGSADPYTASYMEYLVCELRQPGLSLMVDFDKTNFIERRRQLRPAASIFFTGERRPDHESLFQDSSVIAIIVSPIPDLPSKCFSVRMDFRTGYEEAARRLIDWRHERIIFLEHGRNPVQAPPSERWDGFASVIAESGRARLDRKFVAEASDCGKLLETIFSGNDRPTAIVCASDGLAIRCISILNGLGLRVPQDVSLVGCDGLSFGMEQPVLSSVRVPHRHVAEVVSRIISDDIYPASQQGKKIMGRSLTIPCHFWDGGTAGPVLK